MTKGELIKAWKGIPSSAEIIVEADHGQTPEMANGIEVSQEDIAGMDLEETRWRTVDSDTRVGRVTAILIR